MTAKIIRITCEGARMEDMATLEHFQGNLKTLDNARAKSIQSSIEKYGFSFPVYVWKAPDGASKIIDGHQRVFVLKEMIEHGWTLPENSVPVSLIFADNEKEAKEKVLLAASQYGRIDEQGLYEFLQVSDIDIEEMRKAIDLPALNMDRFVDEFYKTKGNTDPDAVPEIDRTKTTCKRGDIWQLGDHRLICGSSTEQTDIEKLMDGVKADMVLTDPPYNVNYSGTGAKTSMTILNDNMPEAAFRAFLKDAFASMKFACALNAPVYVCYSSKTHREFEDALNLNNYEVRNQIIWVKTIASMGWGHYRWKHEPILYCAQKGSSPLFYGERCEYTEWKEEPKDEELLKILKKLVQKDESGESTIWRLSREREYRHPTQKPTQLCEIAIANSSKKNGVVLDLFGGSGSTLVACERLGRRCFMSELDPYFCDVIVTRWEEFTGRKATKLGDS